MKTSIATAMIVALATVLSATARCESEEPSSRKLGSRERKVTAFSVAAKGNLLVLTTAGGQIEAWDWSKGKQEWARPAVQLQSQKDELALAPALSPKGDELALKHQYVPGALAYDAKDGKGTGGTVLNKETKTSVLAWGWKGKYVWTGTKSGTVEKLVLGEKEKSKELEIGSEPVTSLGIDPKGKLVVVGDAAGMVYFVSASKPKVASSFEAHAGAVQAIVFHPKGKEFYTCGADGSIKAWTTAKHEELRSWQLDSVSMIAISTKGKRLAAGTAGGSISIWTMDEEGEAPLVISGDKPVVCLAFLRDKKTLAAACGDELVLWDLGAE